MIQARDIEKRFGSRRVLAGLSFDVRAGELLLVTGVNGSGKTTLIRLLAGLNAPTRGDVRIGVDRSGIGFVGHEPLLYRELTARENLDLYARLYRVPDRAARIAALLGRFGLGEAQGERVATYSRGMSQRLALCRALLHDPSVLLLDEPYAALDSDGASLLDAELGSLAGSRTVVVSTHDPDRIDHLATSRLALGTK